MELLIEQPTCKVPMVARAMNASEIKPGMIFTWLTVIDFSHKDKRWRKIWDVKCMCGSIKKILGSALVSGNTKSCGCYGSFSRSQKRIPDNHSEVTAIVLGYKRHAVDRGLSWELSREFVESIIFKSCYYCGSEPSNKKKTKNSIGDGLSYSGMDRIDSSIGYKEGNVVPHAKFAITQKAIWI